ncbi:MAG: leucine-rich repeat protein [Muribaculaceae bacterium]|nr:leucine-rich repeat protein [Muribaculaceae bacterium]
MKGILKHILASVLMVSMAVPAAHSKQISAETARQNAMTALAKARSGKKAAALSAAPAQLTLKQTVSDAGASPLFYIFSRGNDGGFVIASADDRLVPVLGYTDKGDFESVEALPEGLREWIGDYKTAISNYYATGSAEIQAVAEEPETYYPAIEEKVELFWGQDEPFNRKTPIIEYMHAPAGCVGIAMAMAMCYQQYPPTGTGSVSYTNHYDGQPLSYDFSAVEFDYDNMLPYYAGDEEDYEINAAAELCLAAGMSVKSEYRVDGTAADLSASAFRNYFNYPSEGLALLSREYFTPEEWDRLVYEELANDRPVVYRGGGTVGTGGHAFVIDGYKEGLFHINWGWYGDADGYFSLNVLRPGGGGTGSNSDDIYSVNQYIIRGLRHPDKNVPTPLFVANGVDFDKESKLFSINTLNCLGGQNVIYPGVLAINQENGEKTELEEKSGQSMEIADGSSMKQSISYEVDFSALPDGEYILRPVAKLVDDETINPGGYDEFYPVYCTLMGQRYVKITIKNGEIEKSETGTDANNDIEFTNFRSQTTLITGSNLGFDMDGENRGNTIIQSVNVWVYKHNSDELAVNTSYRTNLVLEPGMKGTFNLGLPTMNNMGGVFDLEVTNSADKNIKYSKRIPFEIANSNNGAIVDDFKFVITSEEKKTVAVVKRNGYSYSGELTLPETVEINGKSYTLTEISNAFMFDNSKITKVVIPPSVKMIAGSSFGRCSLLEEINLPEGLEFLGGGSFSDCKALKSIKIPSSLKVLNNKTFQYSGLTSVELPDGLEKIGDDCFRGCPIEKLILPSTIKQIGDNAFNNANVKMVICSAIEPPTAFDESFSSYTYKNAPLFVPEESSASYKKAAVWKNFSSSYPINNQKYVKDNEIWYELTDNFEAKLIPPMEGEEYTMTRVVIPSAIKVSGLDYTVIEVADYAFCGVNSITSITGGANVKRIGAHAYEGTSISSANLTSNIKEIGEYAYYNSGVKTLGAFPPALERIGAYAFAENREFHYSRPLNADYWLQFPETLAYIGDGAFMNCESFTNISINSEIELGDDAFSGCSGFTCCLFNGVLPEEFVRKIATQSLHTGFFIEPALRPEYEKMMPEGSHLYDLLQPPTWEWDGDPYLSEITEVKIKFESTLGYPQISNMLAVNNWYKVLATTKVVTYEGYEETGEVILEMTPVETGEGSLMINFLQPGLSCMIPFNVVATADVIKTITLSPTEKTLKANETFEIVATTTPEQTADDYLTWESSNTAVATVSEVGGVTAVGAGTATITCRAYRGNASAKCAVTVTVDKRPGKALDEENLDAPITVADVVAIANHIMGDTHERFNEGNADANGDGDITISDISTTIQFILDQGETLEKNMMDSEGSEVSRMRIRPTEEGNEANVLNFGEIWFENSETAVSYIGLETADDVTALQADIICPDNVEISDIELDNVSSHRLSWKRLNNGNYRVVVTSLRNALLPTAPASIIKLSLQKGCNPLGTMKVSNAWISTPAAEKETLYAIGGAVALPTGVEYPLADFTEPFADVYSLEGMLIKRNAEVGSLASELAPGVYILRGKKEVSKIVVR